MTLSKGSGSVQEENAFSPQLASRGRECITPMTTNIIAQLADIHRQQQMEINILRRLVSLELVFTWFLDADEVCFELSYFEFGFGSDWWSMLALAIGEC